MATINMPKKEAVEAEPMKVDQRRPSMLRFRLQVDRQTKSSFDSMAAAETAGKAIKKAFPVVQVTVYDAQEHQQKILT
jgi:adenylyl- and sulfurtransferase ThiI